MKKVKINTPSELRKELDQIEEIILSSNNP